MPDSRGEIQRKLMSFYPKLQADYAADYATMIEFLGQEADPNRIANWCYYLEHHINSVCQRGINSLEMMEREIGFEHPAVCIMNLEEPQNAHDRFPDVAKRFCARFIKDDRAYVFNDYGAGELHGVFTHRVQWCLIALASGQTEQHPSTRNALALNRKIVELYKHIADPSCYDTDHGRIKSKGVWDYAVDAMPDNTQENFGFRKWRQARIPERLRKLLTPALGGAAPLRGSTAS